MSDIAKDIKIVKDLVLNYDGTWYSSIIFDADIIEKAIENVLSELQGLREFSTETVRRNAELQAELETYKKTAEKLEKN